LYNNIQFSKLYKFY